IPYTKPTGVNAGSSNGCGRASRGSDGGGDGAAATSSAAACTRIWGMSLCVLPWRLSHSSILRSALARSPGCAALSMNTRKYLAKRWGGVLMPRLHHLVVVGAHAGLCVAYGNEPIDREWRAAARRLPSSSALPRSVGLCDCRAE